MLKGEAWITSPQRRARDVALATALSTVALPAVGCGLVASRLTVGRHPLFKQQRIGKGGEPFTMLKIRTMPENTAESPGTGPLDERATGIGRLLRRLSIDELPQLTNIIRGDMSLFAPRALLAQEISIMREIVPHDIFKEWNEVYMRHGPGCLSSFVNACHNRVQSVNFENDYLLRAELDILDYEQASPACDREILMETMGRVGRTMLNLTTADIFHR